MNYKADNKTVEEITQQILNNLSKQAYRESLVKVTEVQQYLYSRKIIIIIKRTETTLGIVASTKITNSYILFSIFYYYKRIESILGIVLCYKLTNSFDSTLFFSYS